MGLQIFLYQGLAGLLQNVYNFIAAVMFLYLTNSGHPGNFQLSTALAFQFQFTKKEVDILANVETFYKMYI